MDWLDLYVWQDAARDYLSVLDGNNKQATETISRLHSVIADIDINNIGKTLEQFNVNQTDIISDVDGWINTAQSLVERIGQNLPQFKSIDEKISEVFKFCNNLNATLSFERDIFLIPRLDTDPTRGDEDAGERLKSYLNGDYGDIDFTLFYNQFININLLGTIAADDFDPEYHALLVHAERRRLNHLINICTDEHIKNTLSEMLDGVQCDIDTYYHVVPLIPTPDPETITAEATTPATSPSTEATATPNIALPDFSHMESYTPTIAFDMSALYSFLVAEGVISKIDEKLFTESIIHAHMNEVWKVGNHHKLKCVFRHLKDHFPNDWIDVVAERMETTRKIITALERSKIGDFEMRLRDII